MIGLALTAVMRKPTPKDHHQALTEYFEAAVGTLLRGMFVCRTATYTRLTIEITTLGFV